MTGTAESIEELIRDVPLAGVSSYPELLQVARKHRFEGAGVSGGPGKKVYLLFIGGEPEGAVFIDGKGELYGDKAVYLIRGDETFSRYPLGHGLVERMVFGCRIHTKSHFSGQPSLEIPEFGKKADGIGRLIITLKRGGSALAGVPVKIRKEGQVVAHDSTDREGMASFRLLFGRYELLILRQEDDMDVYDFSFVPEFNERPLELEVA